MLALLALKVALAADPSPAIPRLSRVPIGTCGCEAYVPPGLSFGEPSKSEDGSDVWTGEVTLDGWRYGVVAVRFAEPFAGTSPEDREALLVSYMEFLRGQWNVTASAGVGGGHTQADHPDVRGVIDYWQDAAGQQWAVAGWVDDSRLAVLFIAGNGDYPWLNLQQAYLDGFRFP